MVVDATANLNINVLAEAIAYIDAIRELDGGSGIWYNLYPEAQQGYCHIGAQCWINLRLRNAGTAAGNIYIMIKRMDTGAVVWNQSYSLAVGQYVDLDQINFIMPSSNLTLNFEIGH